MITIRAKSKTGQLVDFEVDQLISIDGEPVTANYGEMLEHMVRLEGRLQAVENNITLLTNQPLAGV